MQTSVVGFVRWGKDREFKRIVEQYFAGEITEAALAQQLEHLQQTLWQTQLAAGLDEIVCGDFSWYDHMLDTAFLVGATPQSSLSYTEQYFALARGLQTATHDIAAWGLKKWFDTNYHYIVPQLAADQYFELRPAHLLRQVKLAQQLTANVRVSLVGPLTFIALSAVAPHADKVQLAQRVSAVYRQLMEQLAQMGVTTVQIDEPILCSDANPFTQAAVKEILTKLSSAAVNVGLQTYFGEISEWLPLLAEMPFAAIGLDYTNKANRQALAKLPAAQVAAKKWWLGVVSGRNVWRTDYAQVIALLRQAPVSLADVTLTTTCSLLHVPYTVAGELLPASIKAKLAFAVEKLTELAELKVILTTPTSPAAKQYLAANQKVHATPAGTYDEHLAAKVTHAFTTKVERTPDLHERRRLQDQHFKLPLLPTTTIGSLPQSEAIKELRRNWRAHKLSTAEYEAKLTHHMREWLRWQEEAGLDVLVHGEFERADMVEYFATKLTGMAVTTNGWVQSYGTRGVKPPIIYGQIRRDRSLTGTWLQQAQAATARPVKGMLTGPVTLLNWSFELPQIPRKQSAYELAFALQEEVAALQKQGIEIIQLDEAALRERLPLRKRDWPEYLEWAKNAFQIAVAQAKPTTQIHTHMCYSEFGDILPLLDQLGADVVSLEAKRAHMQLVAQLATAKLQVQVGPGVYDIHSPRIPNQTEVEADLRHILSQLPPEQVWVNPDCGLKTRSAAQVKASLTNMVAAAKILRSEINQ